MTEKRSRSVVFIAVAAFNVYFPPLIDITLYVAKTQISQRYHIKTFYSSSRHGVDYFNYKFCVIVSYKNNKTLCWIDLLLKLIRMTVKNGGCKKHCQIRPAV